MEKLKAHAAGGPLPMHMPGHKRNAGLFPWLGALGCELDITEIDGFDDLNDPQGLFRDLERRTAALWGARESVLLVNGSTGGVLAAVRAGLERGGELLMARGCHRSVYHAGELTGAAVHYLVPRTVGPGLWGSVTAQEVAQALDRWPAVRLVAVTSPTYEGVISDIRAIAAVCHSHGALLLVDEAHGSHLGFGRFPAGAVRQGADLVVQSLHKTLPSLTQTAVLHIAGPRLDPADVRRNAAVFQTSSPSYLLSASMAGCIAFLEREGDQAAERWLAALDRFRALIRPLAHIGLWEGQGQVFQRDPSKLVLTGPEGPRLMALLRRQQVEPEMAAGRYVLAMTGMGDTEESLTRLAQALAAVDGDWAGCPPAPDTPPFSLPKQALSVHSALTAPGRSLPLAQAVGRVCGEYVWAYPPGAPLIVPGEVVDQAAADAIAAGVHVHSGRGGAPERIFCVGEY